MSVLVPRSIAIKNLQKYIGCELSDYAAQYNVTIAGNKGWKGHVLEHLAGLNVNSRRAPNGLDFELKSVAFILKKNAWQPKETMAITMINPQEIIQTPFLKSHLWEKLKSLLLCQVAWDGYHADKAKFVGIASWDMNTDGQLLSEVEQDYCLIQEICRDEGFEALSGRMGKWIQPRTKGPGGINKRTGEPNKKTRAFYARKIFITHLLNSGSV